MLQWKHWKSSLKYMKKYICAKFICSRGPQIWHWPCWPRTTFPHHCRAGTHPSASNKSNCWTATSPTETYGWTTGAAQKSRNKHGLPRWIIPRCTKMYQADSSDSRPSPAFLLGQASLGKLPEFLADPPTSAPASANFSCQDPYHDGPT